MASYLVNPPHISPQLKTPEEIWSGNPVGYSNLKVFDCLAYAHVNHEKLEPKARKCIFLGYSVGVKGYRLWPPDLNKVIISRDITFNESLLLHLEKEVIVLLPFMQVMSWRIPSRRWSTNWRFLI